MTMNRTEDSIHFDGFMKALSQTNEELKNSNNINKNLDKYRQMVMSTIKQVEEGDIFLI